MRAHRSRTALILHGGGEGRGPPSGQLTFLVLFLYDMRIPNLLGEGLIMAIKGTGDVFSPKVVHAAAGSILRMPVIHAEDTEIAVNMLRKAGKIITVTSLDADMYFYQADLTKKTALVIFHWS